MSERQVKFSSIKEVSAEAGVPDSKLPADANGRADRMNAAEETRRHILEAAPDLLLSTETANAVAQMKKNSPFTYLNIHGFLGLGDEFIAEVIGGLLEGCNVEDRDLNIQRTLTVEGYRQKLLNGDVAGLILHAYMGHPVVDMLAGSSLPVVAICDSIAHFPSVVVDDDAGGRMLAHYLSDRGYRRVVYRRIIHEIETSRRRYEAFMDVAEMRRMDVTVFDVDNDFVLSQEEIAFLNDVENQPCAVTGWRDLSLMAVARFCRESGLRVPEDVALAGFDGMSMVPQVNGVLTTVVAPWSSVAKKSISVLTAMMRGEDVPEETVLPVRLRIGDTT